MKAPQRLQPLVDEGFIDTVVRQLMSGKEATVYLVRCGDGAVGEVVHQSLVLAFALGHGQKFVPSLVEAQEQITGAKLVPR